MGDWGEYVISLVAADYIPLIVTGDHGCLVIGDKRKTVVLA